ncbi:MAG: pirin family protein [Gammaproteobacteria bacterium]|nr:pirin family protein [Gammaproteobacteria bacterium]
MATADRIRLLPAMEVQEGSGVKVYRSIGIPALRNRDPFMMLDYFSSDKPDEYLAGFPSHPHRGFVTFTYMIDGQMQHEDSMGNRGKISSGDAQWMKAGSGVIHSEMPQQKAGLMRGFQLWINLPARHKMEQPEYQEYAASSFPLIETDAYRLKVLIGSFAGQDAPIVDEITQVRYFDLQLKAGQHFQIPLSDQRQQLVYLFEGEARLGDRYLGLNTLAVLDSDEESIELIASEQGARFILVSGQAINEPVVQYGPFVMNNREEIDQALLDFQENNFVRQRAWIKTR